MVRWLWGALIVGDIVRRKTTWYVRYRDADGVRRMRASHQPTKELARRYLLEIEARVARGVVGIPEPAPAAPTVVELVERFLSEYSRPRLKDIGEYRLNARCAIRRALPLIGDRRADRLRITDMAQLRDALSRTHAPASVRSTLAFLGTMFSWAVKGGIVPVNPIRGVERPVAPSSLEYLSIDEVQALLQLAAQRAAAGTVADRCLYTCVHFALHTGLRRGELFGLRLQDVDLRTRRLTVARSYQGPPKGGKTRHIRLPADVVPVLASWLAEVPRHLGVVFPITTGPHPRLGTNNDLMGLPELLADAGCRPHVHMWHVLRHTFASHYVMAGGNLLALQKILGHANVAQTMQYAHLGDDFIAGEVDRLKF